MQNVFYFLGKCFSSRSVSSCVFLVGGKGRVKCILSHTFVRFEKGLSCETEEGTRNPLSSSPPPPPPEPFKFLWRECSELTLWENALWGWKGGPKTDATDWVVLRPCLIFSIKGWRQEKTSLFKATAGNIFSPSISPPTSVCCAKKEVNP